MVPFSCFSSAPWILLFVVSLQLFHYVYCEAIWMSSGMMVTHLGVYGIEMMQYQFLLLFFPLFLHHRLCRSNTLSHCCFPFLPSSSSYMLYCMPIFIDLISCVSHPGLHSDKICGPQGFHLPDSTNISFT